MLLGHFDLYISLGGCLGFVLIILVGNAGQRVVVSRSYTPLYSRHVRLVGQFLVAKLKHILIFAEHPPLSLPLMKRRRSILQL